VGYAAVDGDFRKLLEDSVPGSDLLLEALLGPPSIVQPPPPKSVSSKLKISSPVVVTKPKEELESTPEVSTPPPLPPIEDLTINNEAEEVESSAPVVTSTEAESPALVEPPKSMESPPEPAEPLNAVEPPTPVVPPPPIEPPTPVEPPKPEVKDEISLTPDSDVPSAPDSGPSKQQEKVETTVIVEDSDMNVAAIKANEVNVAETKAVTEESSIQEIVTAAKTEEAEVAVIESVAEVDKTEEVKATSEELSIEDVVTKTNSEETQVVANFESVTKSDIDEEIATASVNDAPSEGIDPVVSPPTDQSSPNTGENVSEVASEDVPPPIFTEPITDDIENKSLETFLDELCKEMKSTVDNAVSGFDRSSEAVINHIGIMQKVLESDVTVKDDAAWNEMFDAAVAKSDAVKAAEIREKEAIAAIDNVIESISTGRINRTTSSNPNLLLAEEAANKAIYQLDQAKARGSAILSEAKVMEEYRDLVEAGRQQFQKEMASIMPDVKLGEKSGKLTEDELNMFISHAYRKVLFLQQEVARQQTLEQERFKKALEKQRAEIQIVASEKIENELERQKRDLELEHDRRMTVIRDDAEAEIRAQLRRQAAAHSDHLADVLSVQSLEMNRKHIHDMDEKLSQAQTEYLTNLAGLSGSVSGLSEALTSRADSDKAALRAQSLWLACTGFSNSLVSGKSGADTWENKLLPLDEEVKTILAVAREDDLFVSSVLASVSPVALARGVYTEDSLKERWTRVEKVARRVGGIGEEGGSLISYGLSYLQSLLLVDLSIRSPGEVEESLDPAQLSPTDLVNLARHSLDRGNLGRAVQYVTLLSGESGRVARDWLEEARLTLEMRQAAEALLSHAEADGVRVLPRY